MALTHADRAQLNRWARTGNARLVTRSRIVLLAADGLTSSAIATRLHVTGATVRLWRRRFTRGGIAALEREAPGRGRRPGMDAAKVDATFRALHQFTRYGVRWSARAVADWARVSAATVWRIVRRYGIDTLSTCADIEAAWQRALADTRCAGN